MAESGRVPGKCRILASIIKLPDEYRKRVKSIWILKNGRIRVCIGKKLNSCEYRKTVLASTGTESNLCEYRKMVECGRVRGKSRIRAIVEKLSRRVPEKGRICVSTEKWQNPGKYREKVESVRVSKNCPYEYRKRVESVWVPKHRTMRESTGKK